MGIQSNIVGALGAVAGAKISVAKAIQAKQEQGVASKTKDELLKTQIAKRERAEINKEYAQAKLNQLLKKQEEANKKAKERIDAKRGQKQNYLKPKGILALYGGQNG